jgi:1,2-diacylglycerol 3-beta-glucosyltransferase
MVLLLLGMAFWAAASISLIVSSYLFTLSLASLLPAKRRISNVCGPMTRFSVVIPAHNEEVLLPALLRSLSSQIYPRDHFSVLVIADNCTDQTVSVARVGGATVFERRAPEAPGKGQALRWLFDQIVDHADTDAYVFIDADSLVDPNFLTEMHARIKAGAVILQASYRVSDATSHALVSLRALAFSLVHDLRGRGKERLGLSAGLLGNGMVMIRDVVERIPWGSFSAVEDAEQHIQIVLSGARAEFVSSTHVYGYMPSTFKNAKDQQRRWEGGRLNLLRIYGWQLLSAAVRRRSKVLLASSLDVVLPPTSVILLVNASVLATGVLSGGLWSTVALVGTVELCGYVAIGFLSSGLPPKVYLAILYAPPYILWKAWLFACQLPKKSGPAWLPTSRNS